MFWLFVWWLWWERVCRSMFNIYIRLGLWWKRICRSMFNIYIRFGRGGGLIFMFWFFLWGCGGRGFTDLCSISISVLGCGGRGFADLCSIFISDLDYSSKQNLFYVFGVFLDNRVRGRPLINVFPRVYFDFFGPTSRFQFYSSKQNLFYVFGVSIKTEFVLCFSSFCTYQGERGPLINVFLRVYFDVFCQNSRFYFPSSKQSYFYVIRVFVDSRGRGDP